MKPKLSLRTAWTAVLAATAAVLAVPLVAMRFTPDVLWTPGDFAAAAVLLLGAGLTGITVLRRVPAGPRRWLALAGVGLALGLVWAELAVGVLS